MQCIIIMHCRPVMYVYIIIATQVLGVGQSPVGQVLLHAMHNYNAL